MKPLLLIRAVFCLILAFSQFALANQSDNPYQGMVGVNDQSETLLQKQALQQVLVRVSGNLSAASLPESKKLADNMQSILAQYGYRTYKGVSYYMAQFDQQKINNALKAMQQPIWGDTRPATVIWLSKNGVLVSDKMFNEGSDSSLSWSLQHAQLQRAIEFKFPLMDLEDSEKISAADVTGRFYDQIGSASKRYGVNHFIVANLRTYGKSWQLKWALTQNNGKLNKVLISGRVYGEKGAVLGKMSNKVANYYASKYAILEGDGKKLTQTIYIDGIYSLAQVTKLNKVLGHMRAVDNFEILAIEQQQVTVQVSINGGLSSFANALSAQSRLHLHNKGNELFHYKWR